MKLNEIKNKLKKLKIFEGIITIKPLKGGITNLNYIISDDKKKYVLRLGKDLIHHQVLRFHELASSKAAYEIGIAPKVIYHEDGLLVLEYIDALPLSSKKLKKNDSLKKIISLIKFMHNEMPKKFNGPAMIFWVFHVIRDYAKTLENNNSPYVNLLDNFLKENTLFEKITKPYEIVFCHNDLLAGNILDDGKKFWIIDWEYAGFSSPLFDLACFASNNNLDDNEEDFLLEEYYDGKDILNLKYKYKAMKCCAILRETMWSMVSEIKSEIDFDFKSYTKEKLNFYEKQIKSFKELSP